MANMLIQKGTRFLFHGNEFAVVEVYPDGTFRLNTGAIIGSDVPGQIDATWFFTNTEPITTALTERKGEIKPEPYPFTPTRNRPPNVRVRDFINGVISKIKGIK